jgi:CubicO group peptidase (beta-lactamase class C family)
MSSAEIFMAEKQIPGLSLAIVQAPYISRSVAYGISDLEQHRLASSNTVWNAGPISQGYAAVAVMQLYEQGKLDIREKLSIQGSMEQQL